MNVMMTGTAADIHSFLFGTVTAHERACKALSRAWSCRRQAQAMIAAFGLRESLAVHDRAVKRAIEEIRASKI